MGTADNNSIIDLTSFEDNINPLVRQPPPPTNKRTRPPSNEVISLVEDETPDIRPPQRQLSVPARKKPKQRQHHESHLWENDGLEVVSETVLTPQEKLKRIQEQHAQGKPVELRPETRAGTVPPRSSEGFSYGQFSFARMLNNHPFLLPPLHNHLPPGIVPFFERGGREAEDSLERRILQRTLNNSMDDHSGRQSVSVDKILKPKDPAPARPGFTRSLTTEDDLVCIMCDHKLGEPKECSTESGKRQSQRVFVRGCSHVYCGQCTMNMGLLPKNKSYCPVAACRKEVPSRHRNKFREVFI